MTSEKDESISYEELYKDFIFSQKEKSRTQEDIYNDIIETIEDCFDLNNLHTKFFNVADNQFKHELRAIKESAEKSKMDLGKLTIRLESAISEKETQKIKFSRPFQLTVIQSICSDIRAFGRLKQYKELEKQSKAENPSPLLPESSDDRSVTKLEKNKKLSDIDYIKIKTSKYGRLIDCPNEYDQPAKLKFIKSVLESAGIEIRDIKVDGFNFSIDMDDKNRLHLEEFLQNPPMHFTSEDWERELILITSAKQLVDKKEKLATSYSPTLFAGRENSHALPPSFYENVKTLLNKCDESIKKLASLEVSSRELGQYKESIDTALNQQNQPFTQTIADKIIKRLTGISKELERHVSILESPYRISKIGY
jgi:hypothetical protein